MKIEGVLQFADVLHVTPKRQNGSTTSNVTKIDSIFQKTDNYLKQNMLTLSRDKTEGLVFPQKNQHHIEQFHYNGNTKPKVSCRYLGLNETSFNIKSKNCIF